MKIIFDVNNPVRGNRDRTTSCRYGLDAESDSKDISFSFICKITVFYLMLLSELGHLEI
jgi:hypothetical protein